MLLDSFSDHMKNVFDLDELNTLNETDIVSHYHWSCVK